MKGEGMSRVKFATDAGDDRAMKLRRSKQVKKILGSVSEMTEKNCSDIFTRAGRGQF